MIPRYEDTEIAGIWSDPNKLGLWQKTELAVIEAQARLGNLDERIWKNIDALLAAAPIDISWWLQRDGEIHHDLNAFVDERRRHLPEDIQSYFHDILTSYDVEEPAFSQMLLQSAAHAEKSLSEIMGILKIMALDHRYTIMIGRTHGQEAELQSFGKRCLTWFKALAVDSFNLETAKSCLRCSKISGAVGNYGSINPETEKKALEILGLKPFYGATQIMPREIHAPLAQALCQIVMTLDKIATDIRLGARSSRPIYQEPFGKKQKGSSRMPHKKNTVSTEQIEGMARMAQGYCNMILANIKTWEERAIEQSCVERVAWPDLFHITVYSLKTMARILGGLVVYPDHMLSEIMDSKGCYAAGEAKSFLARFGFSAEEAYRVVQLAAFNAFAPTGAEEQLRNNLPSSLREAEKNLERFQALQEIGGQVRLSIKDIILRAELNFSSELDATEEDIERWNKMLENIFEEPCNVQEFCQLFSIPHLLHYENTLFQEILGI